MNTRFWQHYSMQFSIHLGWDYEQDLKEFVSNNRDKYNESSFTVDGTDITEWEIFNLGQGSVVGNAQLLLDKLKYIANLEENVSRPDDVLLDSVHSGSSEYLYIRDCF